MTKAITDATFEAETKDGQVVKQVAGVHTAAQIKQIMTELG